MTGQEALFLSIRPEFANAIVAGTKSIELRRTRPRAQPGLSAVIYASSPVMSVLAIARIVRIETDQPRLLWSSVSDFAGITKRAYDQYFDGAEKAVAIELGDVRVLDDPISLTRLREIWPAFQPPQGFRYVPSEDICSVGYFGEYAASTSSQSFTRST